MINDRWPRPPLPNVEGVHKDSKKAYPHYQSGNYFRFLSFTENKRVLHYHTFSFFVVFVAAAAVALVTWIIRS